METPEQLRARITARLDAPRAAPAARGSAKRKSCAGPADEPSVGKPAHAPSAGVGGPPPKDGALYTHDAAEPPSPEPPPLDAPAAAPPHNPNGTNDGLEQTLAECAKLDHSDTDNGKRLIAYFGRDLIVRAESEVAGGSFLKWVGTHWDLDGGAAGASMIAQQVGPLIVREADFLQPFPAEAAAIAAADKARAELKSAVPIGEDQQHELEEAIKAGRAARQALAQRRTARRKFGISSKNNGRIEAMKTCAAPHLRRPVEVFNADPLVV
jgi:putative DNA primase/helicase